MRQKKKTKRKDLKNSKKMSSIASRQYDGWHLFKMCESQFILLKVDVNKQRSLLLLFEQVTKNVCMKRNLVLFTFVVPFFTLELFFVILLGKAFRWKESSYLREGVVQLLTLLSLFQYAEKFVENSPHSTFSSFSRNNELDEIKKGHYFMTTNI